MLLKIKIQKYMKSFKSFWRERDKQREKGRERQTERERERERERVARQEGSKYIDKKMNRWGGRYTVMQIDSYKRERERERFLILITLTI